MDLQTTFYIMGIIFMTISFVFMIAIIVFLLYIKNRVTQLQKNVQEKIEVAATVSQAGGKVIEVAVDKIKEFIEAKNKTKNSDK
jgi:uncharacterized membrane protein